MIFVTGCNIDNWFGNFKEDMYIDTTSEIKFHAYTMNNDDSYTVRERIGNVVNSEELMNLYKSDDNSKQYVKPGWELSGWKIYKVVTANSNSSDFDFNNALKTNGSGLIQEMTITTSNVELSPIWVVSDKTPYIVIHLFENIEDSEFTLNPAFTQILYGTTFSKYTVYPISVTGFSLEPSEPSSKEVTVSEDGNATASFKYVRKIISINVDYNGDDAGTAPFSGSEKYGKLITGLINPVKTDHSLTGWTATRVSNGDTYEVAVLPSTYPAENTDYKAIWKKNMVKASGITITLPVYSDVDLGLTVSTLNTSAKTFTATVGDTSYSNYVFIFDGNVIQAGPSNVATIDYSSCSSGSYDLIVTATDDVREYSAQSTVVINSGAL